MDSEYWKKQVLNHWNLLDSLARKKFSDPNTADKALLYVMDCLEKDNWQRVRAYKRKSSLKTFLSVVVRRLLDDFSRCEFGRIRVPTWIKERGSLWVEVYRRLCLERMPVIDVVESLSVRVKEDIAPLLIEEAAAVILTNVTDCGKNDKTPISVEPNELEVKIPCDLSLQHLSPEELLIALYRASVLEAVRYLLKDDTEASGNDKIRKLIKQLKKYIRLNHEESLFIRMIYQNGLTVNAAGRRLNWKSSKAHNNHRSLLNRIRKAIEDSGLAQEIKSVIEDFD